MSAPELNEAVAATLRERFAWKPNDCNTTELGYPYRLARDLFVSVHDGGMTADFPNAECLGVRFGVQITISRLWPAQAYDFPLSSNMKDHPVTVAWRVMCEMFRSRNAIIARANELLATASNKFTEPLRFAGCTTPEPKNSAWWGREAAEKSPPVGWAVTISYNRALRIIIDPDPEEDPT